MKIKYFYPALLFAALFFISCNHEVKTGPDYSIEWTETSEGYVKNVIYYESIDEQGSPVTLSGYFSYPETGDVKQIVLFEHGTIMMNSQAPSVVKNGENIPGSTAKGRVIICPDYVGYGVSVNEVHPYMNARLTAVNSVDMELAVLRFFEENNIAVSNDYYTVVAGYSQGGASALAVHRYIETLSDNLQTKINLKESHCGGCPADLCATMMTFMDPSFNITSEHILLSFMVIQGMYESYPHYFQGYTLQDFYKILLSGTYEGYTYDIPALINSKTLQGMTAAGALLATVNIKSVSDVYSAALITPGSDLYNKFIFCLQKNNLTDWEPKAPLYIYHSTEDDVVPYANYEALMADTKMGRYPEKVHGSTGTGTHSGYCLSDYYSKALAALEAMN